MSLDEECRFCCISSLNCSPFLQLPESLRIQYIKYFCNLLNSSPSHFEVEISNSPFCPTCYEILEEISFTMKTLENARKKLADMRGRLEVLFISAQSKCLDKMDYQGQCQPELQPSFKFRQDILKELCSEFVEQPIQMNSEISNYSNSETQNYLNLETRNYPNSESGDYEIDNETDFDAFDELLEDKFRNDNEDFESSQIQINSVSSFAPMTKKKRFDVSDRNVSQKPRKMPPRSNKVARKRTIRKSDQKRNEILQNERNEKWKIDALNSRPYLSLVRLENKLPKETIETLKSQSIKIDKKVFGTLEDSNPDTITTCNFCFETFPSRQIYYCHYSEKHRNISEFRFGCDVCGVKYFYKSLLRRHMEAHLRVPKIRKPELAKSTLRLLKTNELMNGKSDLSQMPKRIYKKSKGVKKRKSNVKKKFICNICSKAFTQSTHLHRHSWTHSREKKFKCEFCNFAHHRNDSLVIHVKARHPGKPIPARIPLPDI